MREEVIENLVDPYAWRDIKYKSENIDKLLEWALQKEDKRVCDKYSNISNTVRHLKNLMVEFTKKADNLEKSLIASTRIQETKLQSTYYRERIKECESSSEQIQTQIQQKNAGLETKQEQANALKRSLMRIKIQNIKLNMKMEEIQHDYWAMEEKQNTRAGKERKKIKKQQQRKLIMRSPSKKNALVEENAKIEIELFNKIDKVKQQRLFIEDCFEVYREKLKKQEKKSNLYGLAGSMLFKLSNREDSLLPKIKKLGDEKLIVYDILKQKYKKHLKSESKKNQKLSITIEQFLNFNPLQIIGILELKGGLKSIVNKKSVMAEPAK